MLPVLWSNSVPLYLYVVALTSVVTKRPSCPFVFTRTTPKQQLDGQLAVFLYAACPFLETNTVQNLKQDRRSGALHTVFW